MFHTFYLADDFLSTEFGVIVLFKPLFLNSTLPVFKRIRDKYPTYPSFNEKFLEGDYPLGKQYAYFAGFILALWTNPKFYIFLPRTAKKAVSTSPKDRKTENSLA